MGRLTVTVTVAAPPERVFALATDLDHAADRLGGAAERHGGIEAIETLTEGPFGLGTRWRETRQIMGGRSTETLEVTALDPPHRYTAECESCGCRYVSTFWFEPHSLDSHHGAGTLVRLEVDTRPLTLLARLMTPLGALMAPGMRKLLAADLADLRRAAEAPE